MSMKSAMLTRTVQSVGASVLSTTAGETLSSIRTTPSLPKSNLTDFLSPALVPTRLRI